MSLKIINSLLFVIPLTNILTIFIIEIMYEPNATEPRWYLIKIRKLSIIGDPRILSFSLKKKKYIILEIFFYFNLEINYSSSKYHWTYIAIKLRNCFIIFPNRNFHASLFHQMNKSIKDGSEFLEKKDLREKFLCVNESKKWGLEKNTSF